MQWACKGRHSRSLAQGLPPRLSGAWSRRSDPGGHTGLKSFYFRRPLPAPHLSFWDRSGILVQEAEGHEARQSWGQNTGDQGLCKVRGPTYRANISKFSQEEGVFKLHVCSRQIGNPGLLFETYFT